MGAPAPREDAPPAGDQAPAPTIDPELLKEEADRAALTPEVAPDLHLPELDSVLALDYFQGTPELVPLVQSEGELNHTTGHNILKLALNPRAASHEIVQLKGVESPVQMHVDKPVIYLRIGDDSGIAHGGTPFTVDTHGAGSSGVKTDSSGGSPNSGYVMVRADVRTDARVLASFNIGALGTTRTQEDVIETDSELLPGGHWMKVTPVHPLDFGEYALMEVVSDREVNTAVWDFGVHPVAPENRDVLKPQPKRPLTLERRDPTSRTQWAETLRIVTRSAAAMVAVLPAGTGTPSSLPATRPNPATETLSRVVFAAYIIVSAARMMA